MDNQTVRTLAELGAIGIAALAILYVLYTSGSTQKATLAVLDKQIENENKHIEREDKQLEESKRHNQQMETFLQKQNELMQKLTEDNIEIKQVIGNIYANQEEIKQGVRAMSTEAIAAELKKLTELFASLDKRVARLEERIPAPSTDIPAEQEGTPTRKLVPPTAFAAEDMIEDVEVQTLKTDATVDNKDNE
jgi:chromosome segregation ATPase